MTSLGPFSDHVGLLAENFSEQLQLILPEQLTYGLILEINNHRIKQKIPWKDIKDCVCSVFGLPTESVLESSICSSFGYIKSQVKALKKSKRQSSQLEAALQKSYYPPKAT